MKFTNKVYDKIKIVVIIIIPAIITLYSSLASIWGFPYAEQIIATLAAINVFLGVIMKISTSTYEKTYDGTLHVDTVTDNSTDRYLFEVDDLDNISDKDHIMLKINTVGTENNTNDTEYTFSEEKV